VGAKICDIFSMAGRYNKPVQCGREFAIKAGRPEATPHLATACKGIKTIWKMKEIFSEVWEKSAAVDSAEPNSKGILLQLRQQFVDTRFLLTQDFVGARFLSAQDFGRRKIFVDVRILSSLEFCQCQ
jgi:hypothetical protein